MSAPGLYRPSLSPQNPEPPGYVNASLEYPDSGYPPLPSGPPPRNPAYVLNSRPLLPPPRPPGYEITTPTRPPLGVVRPAFANLPPYPYHYPEAPSLNQGYDYSRAPSSNLHGQNGLARILLPLPNPYGQPALQQLVSTYFTAPSHPPTITQHLPTHTIATGTPDIRPLENNLSSSATSQPLNTPILSLSPDQLPSPSSEYLEAQFQSLSIENRPLTNLSSASHHVSQSLQSSPETYSTIPIATFTNKLKGKPIALSAEGLPALAPPAVTSCIDDPVTFATDWYWHPDAPRFLICSRCYVDYIHGTRFCDPFRRERFSDGKPRICRFSKLRMRNHLLKDALATGSLELALAWMHSRSQIPDCKGIEGVKGKVGIKWYMARLNDIPGFVSCEDCYEDRILTNHFFVNFEPTQLQPAEDTWSCDIAVPFIEKEYEARGKVNDWAGFVSETKASMSIKPCPQRNPESTYGRKWLVPKRGPEGLVLCSGCYYDRVIHTGEEALCEVDEKLTKAYDSKVWCSMGVFWRSIYKLANEKCCDDDGIEDGIWYTLPPNPLNFGICARCYMTIAESIADLSHPRFRQFMSRLLEMYYTHDPTSFDKFASNKHWYGWIDCTICPECYHDFAQQSPLAANMELNNTLLETNTVCEMYNPRMRDLYIKCSEASPPDARELFTCSMALNQQRFPNVASSHYNQAGMLQDIIHGHMHACGAARVGAVYAQQATQAGASAASGSAILFVGQLEQQ
ncbi:hypothetical protein F4813DRAFT_381825 [Daldinia decipiens]|uniref:uncharacterized protein n=1 Tax=Daldinia decipiens TaxID=326647 RepID=UPI0020C3BB49|nr:uncharacterized protein F4813DRAFT_381825 [Daldinia decipiens]KAI1655993.1 hypothetical protein F4813DRAFT_381825 [Daldinia decipiens]